MKKFASFIMSVSVGLTAMAVSPVAQRAPLSGTVDARTTTVQQFDLSSGVMGAVKRTKAPRKAATTMDQVVGDYYFTSMGCLLRPVDPNDPNTDYVPEGEVNRNVTITLDEQYADSVLIDGLLGGGMPIKGGVNLAEGTLTIPNQFWFLNTYYNQEVWFLHYIRAEVPGEPDRFTPELVSTPMVLTITEEGLDFDENDLIGAAMPKDLSGYFMLTQNNHMERINPYVFDASEWVSAGMAEFEDGWMAPFFATMDQFVAPYEVELLVNKYDNNLLCLSNPYGANTPYAEVNIAPSGHIIMDVTNPDLVLCLPRVLSMTMNEQVSEDEFMDMSYYMFNKEGFYVYVQGGTPEEVAQVLAGAGEEASYLYDNEIIITLCGFGITGDMSNFYTWRGLDDQMVAHIILPEGWENAAQGGVESVNDNTNAPKEYYNLQGIRVANPVDGQLYIVRQGDRSKKIIKK